MNGEQTVDPVPEGQYKAKGIAGSEQYGISGQGEYQVAVDLALLDTPYTVTMALSFAENAAPYSIERLKKLGWKGGSNDSLPGIDTNEVHVVVRYETYKGKRQMRIDIVSSKFSFKNPMDDKEKRDFFSRLNKGASQVKAPKQDNGCPPDWDIPASYERPPVRL